MNFSIAALFVAAKYQITIKDTSYDVEILDDPRQEEVQVKVNGETFTACTKDLSAGAAVASPAPVRKAAPAAAPASAPAAAPVASGPGTVKSPLPGTVNAIKVSAGQKVKPNDELCVIEAMKAMNVIRAQREGTIGKIYVSVGQNIAHNAPLLDIE